MTSCRDGLAGMVPLAAWDWLGRDKVRMRGVTDDLAWAGRSGFEVGSVVGGVEKGQSDGSFRGLPGEVQQSRTCARQPG